MSFFAFGNRVVDRIYDWVGGYKFRSFSDPKNILLISIVGVLFKNFLKLFLVFKNIVLIFKVSFLTNIVLISGRPSFLET